MGNGCRSAAGRTGGAGGDAECRNKDLLREAVPRATAVAAGDDSFARGRYASGAAAREERGFFSVSPYERSGGIAWVGHVQGPHGKVLHKMARLNKTDQIETKKLVLDAVCYKEQ